MTTCIVPIPSTSDFSLDNLPFGIFSTVDRPARAGVAVGDFVIDLAALHPHTNWTVPLESLDTAVLNSLIAHGKSTTNEIRQQLRSWLCDSQSVLANHPQCIVAAAEVSMHMPIAIGDYTDFYSSMHHAANVGRLYRDPKEALLPNWRHLPVAYHGRASSIVLDGDPIHRPTGQYRSQEGELIFAPTQQLDFELEVAFVVGKESERGRTISVAEAEDYIFGLVLFNDWSARDIQRWEYRPLGPFLGKSFASSMSPWIVPMEALQPFRTNGPVQDPPVLPYLQIDGQHHFDIMLTANIHVAEGGHHQITRTNHKELYWSMTQQLAHHTSNGCNVRIGDVMASGTISGPDSGGYGSLLEMTHGGKKHLQLDGASRSFLQDGDAVTLRGRCENGNSRIGFGSLTNQIVRKA